MSNGNGIGKVGIIDLDSKDKYLEIWVYDDGPSDDPVYSFYRKVENKIIKMGEFDVDMGFFCNGEGILLAANRYAPCVSPRVFNCYYSIENNIFKKYDLDFLNNKDYEYTSNDLFFTKDLKNIEKFEKNASYSSDLIEEGKKYNINKLDQNTKFKILEFVPKNEENSVQDLKIELSDGTTGYLVHPYGRLYLYD